MQKTNYTIPKLPNSLKQPKLKSGTTSLPLPTAVTQLPSTFNTLGRRKREQEAYQKQQQEEQLAKQQAVKEASYKALGGIKDPNDPLSLNSLRDVMNLGALKKRYGKLADNMFGRGLARVLAIFDVTLFQPLVNLFTGDFKALGINMLTSFSEIMDIASNPIKSLIAPLLATKKAKEKDPEKYSLSAGKRFISGMAGLGYMVQDFADMFGVGDKAAPYSEIGEYNWDYDTGFWLSDMALEIVSDPFNYISWGSSTAAKTGTKAMTSAAAKTTGKQLAKLGTEVVEEVTESSFKSATKVAVTVAGAAAEEVFEQTTETAGKQISKQMIKETLGLATQAAEISQAAKGAVHKLGDAGSSVLKTVGSLDEALASSKGFVNDTVVDLIKGTTNKTTGEVTGGLLNQLNEVLSNESIKLTKNQRRTINSLIQSVTDFNTKASRSAGDLLRTLASDHYSLSKIKFTKEGKKQLKEILNTYKDTIKAGGDTAKEAIINRSTDLKKFLTEAESRFLKTGEDLALLTDSPALIKKYKGIDFTDNFLDVADKISLTDYLAGTNAMLQESKAFQVFKAADALSKSTEAAEKTLMRVALLGNPFTAGLYFGLKSPIKDAIGTMFKRGAIKKLTDVSAYYSSKLSVVERAMEYAEYEDAMQRAMRKIDIYAGENLNVGDWSADLAQTVYDETWAWLRGYGDAAAYPNGSRNLMAFPEERVNTLKKLYPERFPIEMPAEEVDKLFFEQFDSLYVKASTGRELQRWDWQGYLDGIKANPNAEATVQQLWRAIDNPATKMSGGSFVRAVSDVSTASARKSAKNIFNSVQKILPNITEATGKVANQETVKTIFRSALKPVKSQIKIVDDAAVALQKTIKALQQVDIIEQQIAAIKAIPNFDPIQVARLQNTISELYVKANAQASLYLRNIAAIINEKTIDPKSPLMKLYKKLRASEIISPYFGKGDVLKSEAKKFIELKNSQQMMTRTILESKDFKYLIDSLRPGQDVHKIVSAEIVRLEQAIADARALAPVDEFGKRVDTIEIAGMLKQYNKLQSLRSSVDSVDAYIEHIALLEQSGLPEGIKAVYLDTLHSFELRDATQFMKNFNNNYYVFRKKMDAQLYSKFYTHQMTLEYYGTKMLQKPEYKERALKYLKNAHTAQTDAEFCQLLFEAEILPELSRMVDIQVVENGVTKTVQQYAHPEFMKFKDRQFVFFDFETTGLNANIDQIYEVGISSPGRKPWSASHHNFTDIDCTEAAKRQLAARGTIPLTEGSNENEVLLSFYRHLRQIQEESGKELAFVGHNSQNFDISFLQKRFTLAADEAARWNNYDELRQLLEAKDWLGRHMEAANLDTLSQLKKLEKIPCVGEYSDQIKNLLQSYTARQMRNHSDLVFNLPKDFLETIRSLPGLNIDNYQQHIDNLYELFKGMRNSNKVWSSRAGNINANGIQVVIDGDYYKPYKDLIFHDGADPTDADIAKLIESQEIQITNPKELIELKGGRWHYRGKALPETIKTSNEAVRFLNSYNIAYAPSWRALNASQQLSTFPVLIEGQVVLETLEGLSPVAFRNSVDTDLIAQFFKYTELDLATNHELTVLAQSMSSTMSRIKNAYSLQIYSEIYSKLYSELLSELSQSEGILKYLKPEINVYQQFSILYNILHDSENPYSAVLRSKLKTQEYRDIREFLFKPEESIFVQPKFAEIFESYERNTRGLYNENYRSRNEYIERIYDIEQRAGSYKARDLKNALEYNKQNILSYTDSFSKGMDKHKVYSATMQKHAIVGQAQVEMNQAYIDFIDTLKDGPEFDTFVALDKQVSNNLEDLVLSKVLLMNPDSLTSFVYHQGKGVVIIPAGSYLADKSFHSFDLKPDLMRFLQTYNGFENEFIKVIKKGDDIIIFAKDYTTNMKMGKIPYRQLQQLDYMQAFDAAYGITPGLLNDYEKIINTIFDEAAKREALSELFSKSPRRAQEFLLTHFDEIQFLRAAHQKQFDAMMRLSVDYKEQYSMMSGGFGRILDTDGMSQVLNTLPEEIRLSVLNGQPIEAVYDSYGSIFNFTTLGRAQYRKAYEPFATSSLQSIQGQTYRHMSFNLSSVSQYAQFYYKDSPLSLSNFYEGATDSQILSAVQLSEDYTVSYMGFDSNGLPQVIELPLNTIEDVAYAKSIGAILLPNQTHASLLKTISSARWSSTKFKAFHKINYFLKASMLVSNPGFMFRNILDSTLKNFTVTRDPTGMMSSYIDAMDYYRRYKETVQMLFGLDPTNPLNPELIALVCDSGSAPMDKDLFLLIHNFIQNGPSAGQLSQIQDLYLSNVKPSMVDSFYEAMLLPTKGIEQIMRLSEYIQLIKTGMTNTAAYGVITRTHFDYGAKSNLARIIELVIPFYSFQVKNFEFWLDMLEKNPILMYNLSNYLTAIWNFEDIDFERIQYYESKLNQVMQANIILNEKGLTLKVNPSFMDPMSILANPIESLSGRVSPLFKPVLDLIQQNDPQGYDLQFTQLAGSATAPIPGLNMVGALTATGAQVAQRYRSGIRAGQYTGSVLPLIDPSIFGATRTPAQYGKASYTNSRAFSDVAKRRPRRINIYNKLYTDTGANRWKLRMMPVDKVSLQYRIRDNQNRFR